jgi:hypothetical protein
MQSGVHRVFLGRMVANSVLENNVWNRFWVTTTYQGCQIFLGPNIPKREKHTHWPQTIPNGHILYQMVINNTKRPYIISNGHKLYQTAVKFTNIFHYKALQNIPKLGFFGLKINNLATLLPISLCMKLSFSAVYYRRQSQYKMPRKLWLWRLKLIASSICQISSTSLPAVPPPPKKKSYFWPSWTEWPVGVFFIAQKVAQSVFAQINT